jgi:uncharacterized phage protein gp47/JayE
MANGESSQAYGVTSGGFVTKPLSTILEEAFDRTRQVFGADVDLRSSSPLRKILELCAAEDALLWMRLEDQYYANFIPTAHGRQLDYLGYDLGLERRYEYSEGRVQFKLGGEPKDDCIYVIPLGTVVQTANKVQFRTTQRLALTKESPQGEVPAIALRRGPGGNASPNQINEINAEYMRRFFRFPPPAGHVEVTVQNPVAFSGGDLLEDDLVFRRRLMDLPHTIWTAEALRQATLDVDGVRDCLVWDPYGGLDRTEHWYGSFKFKERLLTQERDHCSPYFFDLVVAPAPEAVWEGSGGLPGVRDEIEATLGDKRPISIFPNILRACEVEIGVKAEVIIRHGFNQNALLAEVKQRVGDYIFHLEMGDDVLASEVLCVMMEVPGVIDVRDLRLLRCPPLYGRVIFCKELKFQDTAIEASCGDNIILETREIAVFKPDSDLIQLEVQAR